MLAIVKIDSITVGERQRSEVDANHIKDLTFDIVHDGLIHAPVVDTNQKLVVGFNRLQACKAIAIPYRYGQMIINPGDIPVNVVKEFDEKVLFRIELSENMKRKNLSPADEAKAIAKLHSLFAEERGDAHSKADTGAALDGMRSEAPRTEAARHKEVADSLIINSFADDPDVKKAKTRAEALRIANKKLEQAFIGGLGAKIQPKSNDFTLLEGEAQTYWDHLHDASFDGIVCDPPYGIDADEFGEQSHAVGHQYKDSRDSAIVFINTILEQGYHKCKSDAHLYLFCDIRLWPYLAGTAASFGWKPFATPLIWHKPGLGHAPQPGYFGRRYECILFAQKGNRKLSKSASDVFVYPAVKDKIYAAQKPVELLVDLLALSFYPGELVLDPCCGSGSIFRAAKLAKLRATGIEPNPIAIGLSKNAISEVSK